MAKILNDESLRKLFGTVIVNGDESSIRPNSYILRLGKFGEFINVGKEYELGQKKKGIKLQPGHSVAVTAYETLDFQRTTVHKIFPNIDLHGLVSPTTDLSREGLVAPSTQIDAGYHGTLNWTIANTSNEERRFIFKERIFRLVIFALENGELPVNLYEGDYQGEEGYVRSRRAGAPVGMKETEWEDAVTEESPEKLLENLLKSGYPWHALAKQLMVVDEQFETVTSEYAQIKERIDQLTNKFDSLDISSQVRSVLRDEASAMQNRWLVSSGFVLLGIFGIVLTIVTSEPALSFLTTYGKGIGIFMALLAGAGLYFILNQKQH